MMKFTDSKQEQEEQEEQEGQEEQRAKCLKGVVGVAHSIDAEVRKLAESARREVVANKQPKPPKQRGRVGWFGRSAPQRSHLRDSKVRSEESAAKRAQLQSTGASLLERMTQKGVEVAENMRDKAAAGAAANGNSPPKP